MDRILKHLPLSLMALSDQSNTKTTITSERVNMDDHNICDDILIGLHCRVTMSENACFTDEHFIRLDKSGYMLMNSLID